MLKQLGSVWGQFVTWFDQTWVQVIYSTLVFGYGVNLMFHASIWVKIPGLALCILGILNLIFTLTHTGRDDVEPDSDRDR